LWDLLFEVFVLEKLTAEIEVQEFLVLIYFMTGLMSPNYLECNLRARAQNSSPVDFALTKPLFSLKCRKEIDSSGLSR
jgi:hypothetical protein